MICPACGTEDISAVHAWACPTVKRVAQLEAAIQEIAAGFQPDGSYTGRPLYEIAPDVVPKRGNENG